MRTDMKISELIRRAAANKVRLHSLDIATSPAGLKNTGFASAKQLSEELKVPLAKLKKTFVPSERKVMIPEPSDTKKVLLLSFFGGEEGRYYVDVIPVEAYKKGNKLFIDERQMRQYMEV